MSYEYQDNLALLSEEAVARYITKISLVGLAKCPYRYKADSWIDDPKEWPPLEYGNIYNYLIKSPRIYSPEAMENYKSLEAYRFFIAGWVQTIYHMKTDRCFVLKACVTPSYRTTDPPHNPWVAVNEDGVVLYGHCDCMAGLGETCSHVGAILFKMEAGKRLGFTASACTDIPCIWNQCFTKTVEMATIAEIEFYTKEAKEKITMKPRKLKDCPTPEEEQNILQALHKCDPTTVCLSGFKEFNVNFVKKPVPVPVPVPIDGIDDIDTGISKVKTYDISKVKLCYLRDLYDPTFNALSEADLDAKCFDAVAKIKKMTEAEVIYIQEITKPQAMCIAWHELRKGRITASIAHEVCHTNKDNPAPSLMKKICCPTNISGIAALDYGNIHEKDAVQAYCCSMGVLDEEDLDNPPKGYFYSQTSGQHSNVKIRRPGLIISEKFPFIGATPDGLVECDCCGYGVLEVKCPSSLEHCKKIETQFSINDFPIDAGKNMRKSHKYYSQVQLQMFLVPANYCDFVVWTPYDSVQVRVKKDEPFIDTMLDKMEFIFNNHIIRELLTRRIEMKLPVTRKIPEVKSLKVTYCKCKTKTNVTGMVGCDACDDWFHPACLNLKKLPNKPVWYCPTCRRKRAKLAKAKLSK